MNATTGDALLQLAQPWGVANGALRSWVPGGDPCGLPSWEGVFCNALGQVTQLCVTLSSTSFDILVFLHIRFLSSRIVDSFEQNDLNGAQI